MQDSAWRPINFLVDYSNIPAVNSTNANAIEYFKNTIFKQVVRNFGSMLKVNGTRVIPKLTRTGCDDELVIPSVYKTSDINADFLIFVKIAFDEDNYLAWAGACLYATDNSRPVMGILQINGKYIKIVPADVEQSVMVISHEFTHALGFSNDLFSKYPIKEANTVIKLTINGVTRTAIKTPGLLSFARTHFGCSTLKGVLIEDEGGDGSAGSHWEKSTLGNEYMTAIANGRMLYSGFTLNFLNDIGWYKVTLTLADRIYWGMNRGCGFGETCSTSAPEFCTTSGDDGCTSDWLEKTSCKKSTFSNNCFINDYSYIFDCQNKINFNYWVSGNKYESPGKNARCFTYTMSSYKMAGCFPATCVRNKINFSIDSVTFTCAISGEKIQAGTLSINCPNIADFCNVYAKKGINDCNGNGIERTDRTCRCQYFYTGVDCSTRQDCQNGESSAFCDIIRPFPRNQVGTKLVSDSDDELINPVADPSSTQSTSTSSSTNTTASSPSTGNTTTTSASPSTNTSATPDVPAPKANQSDTMFNSTPPNTTVLDPTASAWQNLTSAWTYFFGSATLFPLLLPAILFFIYSI